MKNRIFFHILFFIFVFTGSIRAQTYPLSDFVETVLPKPNSPQREGIFRSGFDFKASIEWGKLKIRHYTTTRYDGDSEILAGDGRLMGIDSGEFGGELRFVDGQDNITVIKKGNISFLFEYKHEVYFIESLLHGSINYGALFKVIVQDDGYSYKKILDFDDAPRVMCIANGDILVASISTFYRIHNLQKEKLFPDLLAEDFLPTSLASTDAAHVYMGVTAGYVQMDLINKTYKFFRYIKKATE
jgi:hypothetical protein